MTSVVEYLPSSAAAGDEPALLRDIVLELEARFKSLTDGLDVGVIIHGPDTAILFGNPRAEELLGASMEQLRGKTSFDPRWRALRADGLDFPAPERPTAMAFKTKRAQRGITVGIHRPEMDDRVWLLVSAIPQLNPDGTIRQVVATFTDVTAQKLQQEKIQEQSELILELSVPFIPITSTVALMPVVGVLDAARARRMLDVALTGTTSEGARTVILDMTGVPTITDEAVPELGRVADACRLVGAEVVITGLRGEPARMLTAGNVDLSGIKTLPRLNLAISTILTQHGRRR
ncbi:MAG TPA: PAS domain-containing protein [Polyangium sp.]|nr:PAS domain-containing protein [Polyangium sp.]